MPDHDLSPEAVQLLSGYDRPVRELAIAARALILELLPDATEQWI